MNIESKCVSLYWYTKLATKTVDNFEKVIANAAHTLGQVTLALILCVSKVLVQNWSLIKRVSVDIFKWGFLDNAQEYLKFYLIDKINISIRRITWLLDFYNMAEKLMFGTLWRPAILHFSIEFVLELNEYWVEMCKFILMYKISNKNSW